MSSDPTDAMTNRERIYIDGAWVRSAGTRSIPVMNPANATQLGAVPEGRAEDVSAAVEAATRAFRPWSQTPPTERAKYLSAIADVLERRSDALAELISREVGMPKHQCLEAQIPIADFRVNAELAMTYPFEEAADGFTVVREPVGVVGAITPWNYPLSQIAAKVAPALAAGCTVVVKPSEVAPLNAFVLAEIVHEIGLPGGVFNLISGEGPTVGEALASHPDVAMISFTGSTRAGIRVGALAMQHVARVTLELGGKSPIVILDDADVDAAVAYGVRKCYTNSGQACNALTRMLVPREQLAHVEGVAARVANSLVIGDPLSESTDLGPVVSQVQMERVRGYIQKGMAEGAKLIAGGLDKPAGSGDGYFVRPTVFSDVSNEMTIAREEVFGPVLVIIPYDSEPDAVRIANDTDYGLWGSIWSNDERRAARLARELRVGSVTVNGADATDSAPFGGYKKSGIGREMGRYGLEEYLEVKALLV